MLLLVVGGACCCLVCCVLMIRFWVVVVCRWLWVVVEVGGCCRLWLLSLCVVDLCVVFVVLRCSVCVAG